MRQRLDQPLLAITPGDPEGIGPEIVWKTLRAPEFRSIDLLCIGARKPFEKLGAPIAELGEKRPSKPHVWLLSAPSRATGRRPAGSAAGRDALAGFQSGWAIERAVELVRAGDADALVTGPISKERLQAGGFPYPGHTEFLSRLCSGAPVTMMLANDLLRVSLVTTHVALRRVPAVLTRERLSATILRTAGALRGWFAIRRPRIAVCGLNPHAGEAGLFGDEERRVIAPEVARLARRHRAEFLLEGPLPADTLFAKHLEMPRASGRWDAVVCMYHDQGLIPVKLLDFPNTVNITLGLPIIRTSVDHGVAFDIAGQGIADPSSFQAAVRLALKLARVKNRSASTC